MQFYFNLPTRRPGRSSVLIRKPLSFFVLAWCLFTAVPSIPAPPCETILYNLEALHSDLEVSVNPDGETTILMTLGDDESVDGFLGASLFIPLGQSLHPEISLSVDTSDSWLAGSGFAVSISLNPGKDTLQLEIDQPDCKWVTGSGLLFKVTLEGSQDVQPVNLSLGKPGGYILIDITVGVRLNVLERVVEEHLKIGPNPCRERLEISSTYHAKLRIGFSDSKGRRLIDFNLSPFSYKKVDLSGVSPGIYFVEVFQTGRRRITRKIQVLM